MNDEGCNLVARMMVVPSRVPTFGSGIHVLHRAATGSPQLMAWLGMPWQPAGFTSEGFSADDEIDTKSC